MALGNWSLPAYVTLFIGSQGCTGTGAGCPALRLTPALTPARAPSRLSARRFSFAPSSLLSLTTSTQPSPVSFHLVPRSGNHSPSITSKTRLIFFHKRSRDPLFSQQRIFPRPNRPFDRCRPISPTAIIYPPSVDTTSLFSPTRSFLLKPSSCPESLISPSTISSLPAARALVTVAPRVAPLAALPLLLLVAFRRRSPMPAALPPRARRARLPAL